MCSAADNEDRRYYLFGLLDAVGLKYVGKQSTQDTAEFGELYYRIKNKNKRYFLEIAIEDRNLESARRTADDLWDTLENAIHDLRIPGAYLIRYDPTTQSGYHSLLCWAIIRNIPWA